MKNGLSAGRAHHAQNVWGLPSLVFNGTEVILGNKRQRSYVDLSPTSRSKIVKGRCYTFVLPICLHGVDRENFTFLRGILFLSLCHCSDDFLSDVKCL
jgi:hypothetical protein